MGEPISWPVDLVSFRSGTTVRADDLSELNSLVSAGGYALRRRTPGLEHIAVAPPSRVTAPRETTLRRGEPAPPLDPPPDAPGSSDVSAPAPAPAPRRSRRKTREEKS